MSAATAPAEFSPTVDFVAVLKSCRRFDWRAPSFSVRWSKSPDF
jgi:hypothetical protein